MMGTKLRLFGPLNQVTLEDLVPTHSFYRHVDRVLDLTFVRDLVTPCYAPIGRPLVHISLGLVEKLGCQLLLATVPLCTSLQNATCI
jgi:hypothetical protein